MGFCGLPVLTQHLTLQHRQKEWCVLFCVNLTISTKAEKSSLLLFMLRFLQTTKPPSPCPLPNEFNITSPQADYLWAMNFFPAPEVPHSCYSTVLWGKHKLPSAVSAERGFCVTLFPGMGTCLVMWQHTSSMCFPAPTIPPRLRFICNVIISKHLLGQLTTHRGKS